MKKIVWGALSIVALSSSAAVATSGIFVHVDRSEQCAFIVTNRVLSPGEEIVFKAIGDERPDGQLTIGIYMEGLKAIRYQGMIDVASIPEDELFSFTVGESGKYAFYLNQRGNVCAKDVGVVTLGDIDSVYLEELVLDMGIFNP